MTRLVHPADRTTFRRRFCEAAESQFFGPLDRGVTDCSALLRFAYAAAGPPSPLFETSEGRRYFADAQNLKQRNCTFISRDWRAAEPADLFFFLQLEQSQPFHAMIFLGPRDGGGGLPLAVYHTGSKPGEVRRPSIHELLLHPDPRWRPSAGNASFLGVHRWKILS